MHNANTVSLGARAAAAALMALAVAGCGSGKAPGPDTAQKTVWDHFTVDVGGHPANLQFAVLRPSRSTGSCSAATSPGTRG